MLPFLFPLLLCLPVEATVVLPPAQETLCQTLIQMGREGAERWQNPLPNAAAREQDFQRRRKAREQAVMGALSGDITGWIVFVDRIGTANLSLTVGCPSYYTPEALGGSGVHLRIAFDPESIGAIADWVPRVGCYPDGPYDHHFQCSPTWVRASGHSFRKSTEGYGTMGDVFWFTPTALSVEPLCPVSSAPPQTYADKSQEFQSCPVSR